MKEISISITFECNDSFQVLYQIDVAKRKYVPENIEIRDVSFEKEWVPGKTRITFKGVEK